MSYVKFAIRNSWRQRKRNIFTILTMMVGIAGLINLSGYINRWRYTLAYDAIFLRGKGSVVIYKPDGLRMSSHNPKRYTFSPAEQEKIVSLLKSDPQIIETGRYLMSSGLVSNGCVSTPFELLGYEPDLDQRLRNRPEVRQWCENADVFVAGKKFADYKETNIVGLARGLAKIIGKQTTLDRSEEQAKVSDLKAYCEGPGAKERIASDPNVQLLSLTLDGQFSAADADLAHVYSTGLSITEDTKMVAPLALAQDLFQSQNISYFGVYLNDQTIAQNKADQIAITLAENGLKADVYSWSDIKINPYYVGTMSFLYTIGLFFAVLIFSVVSLSVINLTTMNILDRSREIGTLKALGFNQRTVSWIFFLESAIIAATGCLAGLSLGAFAAEAINSARIKFIPPGAADAVTLLIVPDAMVTISIVAFTFLLVTLSSFITGSRLSRRSCLDLLTKT